MKSIKNDIQYFVKNYSNEIWIILLAFFLAAIGDLEYATIEIAKSHMVGTIIMQLSNFLYVFFVALILLRVLINKLPEHYFYEGTNKKEKKI